VEEVVRQLGSMYMAGAFGGGVEAAAGMGVDEGAQAEGEGKEEVRVDWHQAEVQLA
jgi:hypothetical protein